MLIRKALQGAGLTGLISLIIANALKNAALNSSAEPTMLAIYAPLAAVLLAGAAVIVVALLSIGEGRKLAAASLRQLPKMKQLNAGGLLLKSCVLIFLFVIIPALILRSSMDSRFAITVVYLVVAAAIVLPLCAPLFRKHPASMSCCEPEPLLRRAVIRELQLAGRKGALNVESLLSILLLCALAALTLYLNSRIAGASPQLPALEAGTVLAFIALMLTCRPSSAIMDRAKAAKSKPVRELIAEDKAVTGAPGSILVTVGALAMAFCLILALKSYQPFEELSYERVKGGYRISAVKVWAAERNTLQVPSEYDGLPIVEIGDGAYEGTVIRNAVIPESVRLIGKDAFKDSRLESVKLSKNTALSEGAFAGTPIQSFALPECMDKVPNRLLQNCAYLGTVELHPGTVALGASAFEGCKYLSKLVMSVPDAENSSPDGLGLTENQCLLSDELTEIPERAFYGCKKLTSVRFPKNLLSIGNEAFAGSGLEGALALPDTLIAIGTKAFEGTSVSSVTIPASVQELHEGAFSRSSIREITISKGSTEVHARMFQDCALLEKVTLPDTLTAIGAGAFENCARLQEINIPEGLKGIHENAFKGCRSLESIQIPAGSVLHAGAFNGCGFTSVSLPEGTVELHAEVFANCSDLTEAALPASLTSIGARSFSFCSALQAIELPQKLQTIGAGAFEGCTGLSGVTLPESVTDAGEDAFAGCSALKEVNVSGRVEFHAGALSKTGLTSFAIPAGTQKLHARLFEGCKSLSEVSLPQGLEEIGAHAFEYCTALTGIELPESCKTIGASAFAYAGIKAIKFPGTMLSIESEAFKYSDLEQLVLPDGLTSVRADLCHGCSSLKTVVIPSGVTEIRAHAFQDCSKLSSVKVPASVQTIGSSAFRNCKSLRQITLPKRCSIEKNSFKESNTSISYN